jgi:hypothetical protein
MRTTQEFQSTHLFLLRVWTEHGEGDDDNERDSDAMQVHWCGKLQHMLSGETRTFRGSHSLMDAVLDIVLGSAGESSRPESGLEERK